MEKQTTKVYGNGSMSKAETTSKHMSDVETDDPGTRLDDMARTCPNCGHVRPTPEEIGQGSEEYRRGAQVGMLVRPPLNSSPMRQLRG